jgi:hypothetical protein
MDNTKEFGEKAIKILMSDLLETGGKISKLGQEMGIDGKIAKLTMITFLEKFASDIKNGN